MVIATTARSPVKLGPGVDAVLRKPIPRNGITAMGPRGGRWIWQEVRTANDHFPVIAGIPASVALARANAELRQSLAIGGVVLLLLAIVGYGLHRRLVRPIGVLRVAIEASRAGDTSVRAPTGGPAELAALAGAYNEMIEWREDMEDGLRHLARHDPLTGLPNRLLLQETIETAMAVGAHPQGLGVIFVDLDRFKLINDSYGHATGDLLLRALAARFVESVPANITVGRFGGDEFVFVCVGLGGEVEARGLADLVASVMQAPFKITGQTLYVSGSVGIAVAHAGESADDLIRNADTAMYRAKETERGSSALFDATMRAWAVARLETEGELHRALASEEFELFYQPVCRVVGGQPVAVEALIRWNHPRDGLVSPDRFIPVAEETGLIVPIGTWVVNQACQQIAAWEAAGMAAPRVSVNLAAQQLARADLVECFATALETHDVRPDSIVAEITESAVLVDTHSAVFTLTRLREMGVRVSVDDFGTGYSSLSYLQRLPIDEVKIDRSFIERVAHDRATESIVASVVQLAHALGLEVVAEGVETQEQLDVLVRVGCDLAQGYLLGRPAPASALDHLWTPAGVELRRNASSA
jgi:diguanylate cyclase (GGDEF)-like protein